MRKLISYAEFAEIIGEDVMEQITDCFHQGFNDSVEMINYGNQLGVPVEYEKRTKASFAHDHIKARLKHSLRDNNEIRMDKWRGIFAIKFGEKAFCRIKKFLTGTAKVSVTLTPQQKKFNGQLSMFGFPDEPTFITIGYYCDNPWTELLGVFASCWSADGLEWFQKFGGEGFSQLNLFDTPVVPQIPITRIISPKHVESKPKRVHGKKRPKKDTGTDSGKD